jgi:hypothetical protein
MKNLKALAFLVLFAAASATPIFAQISWSNQSPAGIADDIWSVTYGNGTFAAVTSLGKVLTSTDGLTWSSQTVDQGELLVSIAYGDNTWVVVGAGGTILVSNDLKTWLTAKAATTNQLNGVLYDGTLWIAVGNNATVMTSLDALNWTVQAVPAGVTGFLHGISLDGNIVISGAEAGNGSGSVNMGVLMEMAPNPNTVAGQVYSISIVGVGANLTGTHAAVGNLEAVQRNPDANAVVAAGWGTIIYGIPFSSFQEASVPNVVYRGLVYGNGYWIAAGEQGTILSSTDGIDWTQRFSGDSPTTLSTATLLGAAYSSALQRFVVVGADGTILVSNAQPTVFGNVSTRGYVSSSETFIGGFVVQGTGPRTVLIRGDGPVLSMFSVPSPLADPVLTVYNSAGGVVATNAGWSKNTNATAVSTAALEVGAFALPSGSADSALLLTLAPGSYTVQITSAGGSSGIALFEAYTD